MLPAKHTGTGDGNAGKPEVCVRIRNVVMGAALLAAMGTLVACSNGEARERPGDVPADAPWMDQRGLAFMPGEITAEAGEAVYFTNGESAIHTVDINGENESGVMDRDDVFTWTFDEPGEYEITCEFHPQMNATVSVE